VPLEDIQEAVQGLPVTPAVIHVQDHVHFHPVEVATGVVAVEVDTVAVGVLDHPAEENTGLLVDPP